MRRTRNEALIVVFTLAGAASGQGLLAEFDEAPIVNKCASQGKVDPSMGAVGDLDLDGFNDVFVGGALFSGRDYSKFVEHGAPGSSTLFATAALDDRNGDQIPEFLTATGTCTVNGIVQIHGGAGGVLGAISSGTGESITALADVGDTNASGLDNIVYSGITSLLEPFIVGPGIAYLGAPGSGHFMDIEALGDVDGDGLVDYGYIQLDGPNDDGRVLVHSHFGVIAVIDVDTYTPTGQFAELSGVGDLDGDGHADVLIASGGPAAATRVYSGADLTTVILQFPFFEFAAGPGDVDCDGTPDILLGDHDAMGGAGRVELRSGVDGALIQAVQGAPGEKLGPVRGVGDTNADGVPDWLAAGSGFARLFSGVGPAVDEYCTAKTNSQGCVPAIDSAGLPSFSSSAPFFVTARMVLNQKPGLLFCGTSGRAALPFLGGTLCVQPPLQRTTVLAAGGNPPPDDCSGALLFDFNAWLQSGSDPSLQPGVVVDAQFWMRDPVHPDGTRIGLSDALEFQPCP